MHRPHCHASQASAFIGHPTCTRTVAHTPTAPGARPVGGPGVYGDPDERGVQPDRRLLEGEPPHGGDPRNPRDELGADRHIVPFARVVPAGLQANSWRARRAPQGQDLLVDSSAP